MDRTQTSDGSCSSSTRLTDSWLRCGAAHGFATGLLDSVIASFGPSPLREFATCANYALEQRTPRASIDSGPTGT